MRAPIKQINPPLYTVNGRSLSEPVFFEFITSSYMLKLAKTYAAQALNDGKYDRVEIECNGVLVASNGAI